MLVSLIIVLIPKIPPLPDHDPFASNERHLAADPSDPDPEVSQRRQHHGQISKQQADQHPGIHDHGIDRGRDGCLNAGTVFDLVKCSLVHEM